MESLVCMCVLSQHLYTHNIKYGLRSAFNSPNSFLEGKKTATPGHMKEMRRCKLSKLIQTKYYMLSDVRDNPFEILSKIQGRYDLNSSIKALKSEQEDPPSSTAFLAISPSLIALLLFSSPSSPTMI